MERGLFGQSAPFSGRAAGRKLDRSHGMLEGAERGVFGACRGPGNRLRCGGNRPFDQSLGVAGRDAGKQPFAYGSPDPASAGVGGYRRRLLSVSAGRRGRRGFCRLSGLSGGSVLLAPCR